MVSDQPTTVVIRDDGSTVPVWVMALWGPSPSSGRPHCGGQHRPRWCHMPCLGWPLAGLDIESVPYRPKVISMRALVLAWAWLPYMSAVLPQGLQMVWGEKAGRHTLCHPAIHPRIHLWIQNVIITTSQSDIFNSHDVKSDYLMINQHTHARTHTMKQQRSKHGVTFTCNFNSFIIRVQLRFQRC